MKIIVDANIVFSAILNTNSSIADLLLNSEKNFTFIAPNFLREEISKHYTKLIKISGFSLDDIKRSEALVCKNVNFVSEIVIDELFWPKAEELVENIDINDAVYVAFALHFKCALWTGDKKLSSGLLKKGFKKILTTKDIISSKDDKTHK